VTALDADWHPDCFICAGCNQPLGEENFIEHEGMTYHAACYHERFSPRCAGCGRVITGDSITALGETWHEEHFVCARCSKPLAGQDFFEREGKAYCKADYDFLFTPKCAICGKPLQGIYSINSWGDKYCERHNAELPKCYSCSRLICQSLTGGGEQLGDGRYRCNRCRNTAVDLLEEGTRIMGEVRLVLASFGLDLAAAQIPLRLTDQDELTQLSTHAHASDPSGMACNTLLTRGGKVVERKVEKILILYGLPREHFAAVAAHELGHVWLFLNAFPQLPPEVEEGICELLAYEWIKRQDTPEAQYRLKVMENNKDPVYGEGFRRVRHALEGRTLLSLLEFVRSAGALPVAPA
jgi:hypothetical protein